ncbi:MAG TPA: hypothetical protein VFN57_05465 [Thermomicrobiaceae bacterium]|nr:hypothetical protein [Thermomicrobiaceae bacterium]
MSWFRVLKGSVLTVGIAVLCFLPPIVHLVTGPLSPLIGGYFAGSRFGLNGDESAIVGVVLAIAGGLLVFWLFDAFSVALVARVFFAAFGALFLGVLGGVAAWVGGRNSTQRQDASGTGA